MNIMRRALAVIVAASLGGFAACTIASHRTAVLATNPSSPAAASNARHDRWQPLHKGYVDLSTGLYVREDDDLVVNTPLPIVLRRTYESGDNRSRQFGMDATHPGEWWIYGDNDRRIPWGDLILANGGRVHFVRISPGDTQDTAVLRHDGPDDFNGALLSWTGVRWQMRFPDGSAALFLDCQRKDERCSIVERQDADGHRVTYARNPAGTLLRMESEGQSVAFDYDDQKRIVRADDTTGDEVTYTYDGRGRLVRANSNGVVRTYEYDDRNNMIAVREPGRILRNWFDENNHWVRQVLKASEDDDAPYEGTAQYIVEDGRIVESDFDEGDGLVIDRYDANHYIVSETLDADGPEPIQFDYDRDPVHSVSRGVTLSCAGPTGPITKRLPPGAAAGDDKIAELIREYCRRSR